MVSDKVTYDWGAEFDDGNYKSCFARSVAVNSQYKQLKSPEPSEQLSKSKSNPQVPAKKGIKGLPPLNEPGFESVSVKFRKNQHSTNVEDHRRFSCSSISSSRRTSICSSRISEIPVENIVQQSKVATLQWQLKEVESSREMYKAVMKQVVTFLERAHRSLEILGNRLNTKSTVPRSKSEHHIVPIENGTETLKAVNDYSTFRDFTLRRPKQQELSPEEVPPEKLSQEAFRLLRTAQSLLNTQEPKLTSDNPTTDVEFLAQLAREFPQTEAKPQRTTSFSLSPKLLTPDKETRISTAFNRKLSLQLNETRRITYKYSQSDSFFPPNKEEKQGSPPGGSISSVEDESGFSSMNSFQEVGLPIVGEEVTAKKALLRSMLHNNGDCLRTPDKAGNLADDVKLWQKPEVAHKRWSSTPVEPATAQTVNVLWV